MREGKCDAFTTNSVVGCTGSEVRHAFAWHLLLATPPLGLRLHLRPPLAPRAMCHCRRRRPRRDRTPAARSGTFDGVR